MATQQLSMFDEPEPAVIDADAFDSPWDGDLIGPDGEWIEYEPDAGLRPLFYPGGPDPDPERLGGFTREQWDDYTRRYGGR